MSVVVVESPSKAKTINKYLGSDFEVFASFGHIRDLPAKDGSVDPDKDFEMSWLVEADSNKRLKDIEKALKNHDQLILATDPDREGEAISWHIMDELEKRGKLKGKDVQRVVFNEITKTAVKDAFQHPRMVDQDLVDGVDRLEGAEHVMEQWGSVEIAVVLARHPLARMAHRHEGDDLRHETPSQVTSAGARPSG